MIRNGKFADLKISGHVDRASVVLADVEEIAGDFMSYLTEN